MNKFIGRYIVPHNQYLNSLSEQGLIGLISLLMMMLIPLKVSLHSIRKNAKNKTFSKGVKYEKPVAPSKVLGNTVIV